MLPATKQFFNFTLAALISAPKIHCPFIKSATMLSEDAAAFLKTIVSAASFFT
jgi:hypothetical protein